MTSSPADPAILPSGRLSRALTRLFMKRARVAAAERVAEGFRLITLESPEFRGARWAPGQKVQIAIGSAFVARTFTPMDWDADAGRTHILGYAHAGGGPGSAWLDRAAPGDPCDVFGPRASLDVSRAAGMCVVIGDETSIGLACALARWRPAGSPAACLLEVDRLADVRAVLARLDLHAGELFQRTTGDAHLDDVERRLPELAASGATFVLTGKASSIQRLRRALKGLGVPSSRLATKPYWVPGKTGLD